MLKGYLGVQQESRVWVFQHGAVEKQQLRLSTGHLQLEGVNLAAVVGFDVTHMAAVWDGTTCRLLPAAAHGCRVLAERHVDGKWL